jgi:hypothetical protein
MSGPLKYTMPPDRFMFRSTPPTACATVASEDSTAGGLVCPIIDDRAIPSSSAIQMAVPQTSPDSDQLRRGTESSVSTSSHYSSEYVSLAGMYLDTMIPDDHWRAACLRQIRQNQRKPRLNVDTKHTSHRRSPALAPSPKFSKIVKKEHTSIVKSMSVVKPKMAPPTPPVSPKNQSLRKLSSSGSSDSGFVSLSPSPCPLPYLRIRSTRNRPISPTAETISLDIPASMVGRSCLSCGCTTTTCWRRTLGGIICNSCGLR